jgi:outer membrane protein assembly factor BamD
MIVLVAFVSCSKKAVVKKVDDPGVLYVKGVELMKNKKFNKAVQTFSKLREAYPFDPIAVVAQVKQADAYFAQKEYQMAANTYEDFVNNYPDDENAPYAMKRLAESYEKELPTIDRDQAITFKAVERFTFLKNRYPASPYARDAEEHLRMLDQRLAAREFYVGEFYYRSGNYNACIMRLEYLLSKYPDTEDKEKALFYLIESYKKLDRPEKAQYYRAILLKEFPKSIYTGQISKDRKSPRTKKAHPVSTKTETTSSRTQVPTNPAPAVRFAYEDRRKREIPLVPLAPKSKATEPTSIESPAQEKTVDTAGKADTEPDTGEERESRQPKTALPKTNSTTDQSLPSVDQEVSSSPSDPSDTDSGGRKDDGNKGAKKDSLGFFTGKGPIEINGDAGESLEKGRVLIFKGNVLAKQLDPDPAQIFYLFCDTLTAYTSEDTKEIDRAEAKGNVKMVKQDKTATATQALYYKEPEGKAQLVMKGDVVIFMGKDRLSADTVTYYIDEDRFYVQSGKDKRAKVTITPKK